MKLPARFHKSLATTKLATSVLLLAAATTVSAQSYLTSAPPPAGPSVLNEWLRKQSPDFAAWDIGVQLRSRYESKDNFGTTQFGGPSAGKDDFKKITPNPDNSFTMERVKPHVGYQADWFSAFVEGRGSYSTGDDRQPNPESDGPMALYQAYVTLGNHKEFPLSLKVGRQELAYGEERLVGTADWLNNSRVFDGAKVRWENVWFAADFFSSRVVLPDDNNFNIANDYDWFSGVYATSKLIPKQTTEVYFFSRNDSTGSATATTASGAPAFLNGPAPRDIYTIGTRWKSLPDALAGWDYTVEGAYQFGHFNDPSAPVKSLKQEAYMVSLQGGYTWKKNKFTPRVGLEYNFASGDGNATDGTHGTFENLFPSNHKFYGYMDLVSLQNIHNIRLTSSLKPLPRLTLAVDFHMFWLANTQDNFYTVAGARRTGSASGSGLGYGINSTYGSYVGSEVDLTASYVVCKSATLQAGYSHFFVGDSSSNRSPPRRSARKTPTTFTPK